jgi:hypothetical protein
VWQLLKAVSEPRKIKKKYDELDLWRIEDEW